MKTTELKLFNGKCIFFHYNLFVSADIIEKSLSGNLKQRTDLSPQIHCGGHPHTPPIYTCTTKMRSHAALRKSPPTISKPFAPRRTLSIYFAHKIKCMTTKCFMQQFSLTNKIKMNAFLMVSSF